MSLFLDHKLLSRGNVGANSPLKCTTVTLSLDLPGFGDTDSHIPLMTSAAIPTGSQQPLTWYQNRRRNSSTPTASPLVLMAALALSASVRS